MALRPSAQSIDNAAYRYYNQDGSSDQTTGSDVTTFDRNRTSELTPRYLSIIFLIAMVTAVLCAQKGHSSVDIAAYLSFVFVLVFAVHRP